VLKKDELTLILLDTSASTLGRTGLSEALGTIKQLAQTLYINRKDISIMTFGNDKVEILIKPQRTPKNIKARLNCVKAGGGTPLKKALQQASLFIEKQLYHYESCKLYLFTDGRSTDSVDSINLNCEAIIIDTEKNNINLGFAKKLAKELNANYFDLSFLAS